MPSVRTVLLMVILCGLLSLLFGCSDSPTVSSGGTWEAQVSGTTEDLHGVWGSGASDVFAVGAAGTIRHFNGTSWAGQTSGTPQYLWSVSGVSANNVFAVGASGTILHYNGTAWEPMTSGTTRNLTCVSALASDNVYVGGEQGTILHYDGTSWHQLNSGFTVFITSIYAGAFRVNPAMTTEVTGVVAMTSGGSFYAYDGSTWKLYQSGFYPGSTDFWLPTWQTIFIADANAVIRATPSSWIVYTSPGPNALQGIAGRSFTDISAVGKGMIHFDGTTWSTVNLPTSADLFDIWLPASGGGFAVGRTGTIIRSL